MSTTLDVDAPLVHVISYRGTGKSKSIADRVAEETEVL